MGSLSGKRVVITRAGHQAGELDALLRARGAVPIAYPCVAIESPSDPAPLDAALPVLAAGGFDWLVLTSANTVHALAQRGLSAERCGKASVAAIGPATAASARRLGLEIAVLPAQYDGTALGEVIPLRPGQRVLLPQSEIARPDLAARLAARGAEVSTVAAYRTVVGRGGADLPGLLVAGEVDAVLLASSSAVDGLVARLATEGGDLAHLSGVPLLCIGARTGQTAQACGFETAIVAEQSTAAGLIATLERIVAPIDEEGAAWSRAS